MGWIVIDEIGNGGSMFMMSSDSSISIEDVKNGCV